MSIEAHDYFHWICSCGTKNPLGVWTCQNPECMKQRLDVEHDRIVSENKALLEGASV